MIIRLKKQLHSTGFKRFSIYLVLCFFCSIFNLNAQDIQPLHLSDEEQHYLEQHPVIKLANDPNWEPFEFIDEDGQLQGIGADYIRLFEQQLGVKFESLPNQKWHDLIDTVKSGERPVVIARHATDERKQYMSFTKPYLFFPVVIVAKENEDYVNTPEQLNGRLIAGVKGFNATAHLKKKYPLIPILDVNTIQEGLEAVITGKAYGFVANLGSVNYAIKRHGLDGLQIIGQTGAQAELAIGVHKNEPVLFSIMQKALNSVTPEQAREIYDKWFQLRTINQLDHSQILYIASYVSIVVTLLLVWVLVYRYQKHRQRAYINQINEYSLASLIDINTKKILWCSHAYAALVGYPPEKLVGQSFLNRISKSISPDQIALIEALLRSGKSWTGEVEGINASGTPYWVVLTLSPQKNWLGEVTQVWATRVDITDKKRIEQLSNTDELTGVFNRRYFNEQIEHELNRAKREQSPFAMATFDIDHFKLINDTYGHQQGDEALISLSRLALTRFNRASDFVFRIGGEEFMIITHAKNALVFTEYLEDFRKAVLDLNIENSKSPLGKMSISIGACYWDAHELSDAEGMYQTVDSCLYEAKHQGRNCLILCESTTAIQED